MSLPALGIAITTFNRADMVLAQIAALKELTTCDFELVICDDGSSDDTVARLQSKGTKVIGGANRGIAWNKNRGLFYLREIVASKIILLLDDDIVPTTPGWQREWIDGVERYGHINFKSSGPDILGGSNTAANPGLSHKLGGACIAFSREALAYIGYMDTRFKRYGHEHTDLTMRAIRAGFGGFMLVEGDDRHACFYSIEGGLALLATTSNVDAESVAANSLVLRDSAEEPIYRNAWRTNDEYELLRSEIPGLDGTVAGSPYQREFHSQSYLAANPDVATANWDAWRHFTANGWRENRPLPGKSERSLPYAQYVTRTDQDLQTLRSVTVNGTTIVVNQTGYEEFWSSVEAGLWEPATFNALDSLLRPGGEMVDIGAWIGPLTLYAAQKGHRVDSYECDPIALRALRQNLSQNPAIREKVRVYDFALGDADGTATLYSRKLGNSETSLFKSHERGGQVLDCTATVTCGIRDVRQVFVERGYAADEMSFVKMDIEGAEFELADRLRPLIQTSRCIWCISVHELNINPSHIAAAPARVAALVQLLDAFACLNWFDVQMSPLSKPDVLSAIMNGQWVVHQTLLFSSRESLRVEGAK